MGDYLTLFDGMAAVAQTTSVPAPAMRHFVSRTMPSRAGRATRAPMGVRRLEAALLRAGWDREQVAVVTPEELGRVIGPETRVVGISSGDPLGLGMNDSTMRYIAGGRTWMERWMEQLCARLARIRQRHPFKVIFGGPGAWQFAQAPEAMERLGIDLVMTGCGEITGPEVIGRLAAGEQVPGPVAGERPAVESLPPIVGPTGMGVVEVSRGCGWGCHFCTQAREPMVHLPLETIMADLRTNLAGGVRNTCLISEDILRYGATGSRPDPERLLAMLEAVRSEPGLRLIQLDHLNVTSVMAMSAADLARVGQIITRGVEHRYLWVNLGVETASGRLLAANGGRAKMEPCEPDRWGSYCREAVERLIAAGFLPMVSLVMGLPGEEPEDLEATRRWVAELKDRRLMVFPLFLESIASHQTTFRGDGMSREQWELVRSCYDLNFRWGPAMYQDNLKGAGETLLRRTLLRLSSLAQVALWRWYLRRGRVGRP